ncbi:retrovirus-related Pol polyprotein from type-2 retrotransposable element R2DM [Nephila pilipes]|uniref:Retrovirus-related Pol polyprotein from type-2 retrotransposable element R2DM n=1 Tax=Nephila pilipes TaxID=299642 RepID=A0A8X6QD06_NEPPI|nr:retrovirus-related Pol polyprotein from type-2 retrotransposable element R2DM [Nephila pilipes]
MSDSSSSDSPPLKGTDSFNKLNKSVTPVALRTRQFSSQVSFRRAAELGQCKICPARFDSPLRLRKHVINHKSNAKRRKALEAIDSLYQSTPKPSVSPPTQPRTLFEKFKSSFPELFTQEMIRNPDPNTIFDSEASSSQFVSISDPIVPPIVSPPIQFDSQPSSSPLQDEIILTLNQLINSVTNILDRPSFTNSELSTRSLHPSVCNSTETSSTFNSQDALLPPPVDDVTDHVVSTPASSVALPPAASELQDPVSSSGSPAENSGMLFFNPKPQRGARDESSNSSASSELDHILNSTLHDSALSPEIALLRECVTAFPAARVSPDILELLLTPTQDSDVLLSPGPTASPPSTIVKSPPSDPAPIEISTPPAFSKKSYAQALKKVLAKCPFCEQKFYSQRTCDSHILSIHNPAAVAANQPLKSELPPINEKCLHAPSKNPKTKIIAPITNKSPKFITKVPSKVKTQDLPKVKAQDPPKPLLESSNRRSTIPPVTAYQRKILSLGELEKKPPTVKLFPNLPPYKFFCRHCQEYFPSDQSLADHIKSNHNLLLKFSDQTFHSKIVPIPGPDSGTNFNTSPIPTIVHPNQKVVVPQVEDHSDLVSPVKAFLENYYIPNPDNLKQKLIKKGCLLPNISKTISSSSSSNNTPPAAEINVSVEVHNKPPSQPSPPKQCNLCDFVARKKAGLRLHFYKEHRFHIIPPPAHLADKSEQIDVLPSQEDAPPAIATKKLPKKVSFKILTQPDDSTLTPEVLPPAPGFQDVDSDFQTPPPRRQIHSNQEIHVPPAKFVSFENSILKFSFPLQKKLSCPVPNCSASFGTRLWYLTNSSIKKHLNVFHKSKPSKVEYFCTICSSLIKKLPSKHHCLINNLVLPSDPVDDEVWVCDLCPDFSASTITAKRNHLAFHNRLKNSENKTPLIVPPSASKTKRNRKRRIQVLSEGIPGDTPLARPQRNSNEQPPAVEEEDLPFQEKLDLEQPSLLNSFMDPLDALFDVDEIDNILPTFETVVSDIVSVIQDHFKLSKPAASNDSKNKKSFKPFDPQDAQRVQKLYHWNRKRCVRNLQNPVSSRCSINKSELFEHFSKNWSPSSTLIDFPSVTPPDLPPVVDFLSPEMVFSCLQGCENSAPGPDLISYKHWREIDPRGIILSKIFNICLKIKKIPPSWKQSSCVLIPKKGDLSLTDNWRPISLSSTIYKLFTKCLTRTLQDWC